MRYPLRHGVATAAIVATVFMLPTQPAHAEWPTFDAIQHYLTQQATNAATNAATKIQDKITNLGTVLSDKILNLGDTISDVLERGFTQNANYAKATVGAQEQIQDASNAANARFQRDTRNAQIRDEHTPNPEFCHAVDDGQSGVAASVAAFQVRAAIAAVSDPRGEAAPGTPAYYGRAQAVQALNQLHYARYCSATEQAAGLCSSSGNGNGDQQAMNLFSRGTYPDQAAVDAANDFSTNLIQPIPPAALRGDQLRSIDGQEAIVQRRSYNARMSLARSLLNYAIAAQAPSVQLTEQQQEQVQQQGLPAQTNGSWLQVMGLEVSRRLGDVRYHAALQRMPPASVEREIANQQALANYLALQQYRLSMMHATVDATRLAIEAERALAPATPMPTPSMAAK